VLRSKSPELVLQEIWGHLCCHFAIRTLMTDTAIHAGHDPDRISFVAALRISRQSVAHRGAFPPLTTPTQTTTSGRGSCTSSSPASTRPDARERHHGSSNARCPSGTSNAPATPTGLNP